MEKAKTSLSERQADAMVLKQHYITPAEVNMPMLKMKGSNHKAVIVQSSLDTNQNKESQRNELDGFFLLEATGMGFPEDAQQALIADRKLFSVIEDDMAYFTEMVYIDASENQLNLFSFGAFPKLRELRLACNHISSISQELFGFESLVCLDLSYNHLAIESIQALETLPNLRDLDLSGNKLREIPDDWQHYRTLEKLMLDYNLLENNDIFTFISTAPNLRFLSVYENHLSSFPEVALACDGFKFLDTLDLACNYFNSEAQLEAATRIPRLATLKLYGNPVLGETGEDPLFMYIEGLVDDSIAHREENAPHLPNIDFVTEFPKVRTLKKGQPLGRQGNYRDFAIVQVDNGTALTNRAWRERGNKTIFAETMQNKRRGGKASLEETGASADRDLPDSTFLTSSHALSSSGALVAHNSGGGAHHTQNHHHGHNHGGADRTHDVVADDVMQKVAGDLGLVTSAELLILRDKATINSSVLNFLKKDIPLWEEEEDFDFSHDDGGNKGTGVVGEGDEQGSPSGAVPLSPSERRERMRLRMAQAEEEELQQRMQDQVPGGLFKGPMGDATVLAPQPVALKTAMKALQLALTQPLTSYDELPSKSIMFPSKDYYKPTRSSLLRQMPRHTLPGSEEQPRGDDSDAEDKEEMARYVGGGLGATATAGRGKISASVTQAVAAGGGLGVLNNMSGTGGVSSAVVSVRSSAGTASPGQRTTSPSSRVASRMGKTTEGSAKSKLGTAGAAALAPRRPAGMDNPDLPANRYLHRGLKESSAVRALRQEQRHQTLSQIDDVLQNLNANTAGWAEIQAVQAAKSSSFRGPAAKSEKETMREMRDFAQPFTGVKSLLNMVHDIKREFNS